MKAKYLIAMLALPTVFAACSQDELVPVEEQKEITGKLYGENLTFGVERGVEAETRLTTAGAWEANDTIGMAWVADNYKFGGSASGSSLQAFASAVNVLGNTPLYFVNGTNFRSGTNMFEGSYIAYYPFNSKLQKVGPLKLGVGAVQTSSTLEDAYGKMIFASDSISLQAENAGTGKTPAVTLKRLSNLIALEIALKADKSQYPNVTVSKVVLSATTSTGHALTVEGTVVPSNWTAAKTNTGTASDKYMKALTGTADYLTHSAATAITVNLNEPLSISKATAGTAYIAFMPSDLSGVSGYTLEIYTNYGVVKSSVANAVVMNKWDKANSKYVSAGTDPYSTYDKKAGQLIKQKAVIDITKVDVNNLTATNAAEIRDIVDNWKRKGTSAADININVAHDSSYDPADEGKASAQNIVLDGLNLSDIPAALTLTSADTLVFTGVTNLNATKKITVSGAKAALIFKGETTIGTLDANEAITFEGNTTLNGELTQVPTATGKDIWVKKNVTVTVDAGNLISNTASKSKLVNGGTISLINSGGINKGAASDNLAIVNWYKETFADGSWTHWTGTINIGDADSQGYLDGTTAALFDNKKDDSNNGTVRFFNGEYVTPGEGLVVAVANNAMSFAAAVANNVTTIEVTGEVKFAAFDLDATKGKKTNVILKSGSTLNMGTKTVTLGSVTVKENATITGTKLIVFEGAGASGELTVKANAVLTVGANTEINAYALNLPTNSQIVGDSSTSKVLYKTAGSVGGTYSANVSQKSDLGGVQ